MRQADVLTKQRDCLSPVEARSIEDAIGKAVENQMRKSLASLTSTNSISLPSSSYRITADPDNCGSRKAIPSFTALDLLDQLLRIDTRKRLEDTTSLCLVTGRTTYRRCRNQVSNNQSAILASIDALSELQFYSHTEEVVQKLTDFISSTCCGRWHRGESHIKLNEWKVRYGAEFSPTVQVKKLEPAVIPSKQKMLKVGSPVTALGLLDQLLEIDTLTRLGENDSKCIVTGWTTHCRCNNGVPNNNSAKRASAYSLSRLLFHSNNIEEILMKLKDFIRLTCCRQHHCKYALNILNGWEVRYRAEVSSTSKVKSETTVIQSKQMVPKVGSPLTAVNPSFQVEVEAACQTFLQGLQKKIDVPTSPYACNPSTQSIAKKETDIKTAYSSITEPSIALPQIRYNLRPTEARARNMRKYNSETWDSTVMEAIPARIPVAHPTMVSDKRILNVMRQPLRGAALKDGYIYVYKLPHEKGFFKIGYTARDVHTRISEWERKCGHKVEIVYPPPEARHTKIRNVLRVEELVHAELESYRYREEGCQGCGGNHIEWFATSERHIKAVIAKWTAWIEQGRYYESTYHWILKPQDEDECDRMCTPLRIPEIGKPVPIRQSTLVQPPSALQSKALDLKAVAAWKPRASSTASTVPRSLASQSQEPMQYLDLKKPSNTCNLKSIDLPSLSRSQVSLQYLDLKTHSICTKDGWKPLIPKKKAKPAQSPPSPQRTLRHSTMNLRLGARLDTPKPLLLTRNSAYLQSMPSQSQQPIHYLDLRIPRSACTILLDIPSITRSQQPLQYLDLKTHPLRNTKPLLPRRKVSPNRNSVARVILSQRALDTTEKSVKETIEVKTAALSGPAEGESVTEVADSKPKVLSERFSKVQTTILRQMHHLEWMGTKCSPVCRVAA
jgi:hypothetical protein